jgi:tRNA modification GTPase
MRAPATYTREDMVEFHLPASAPVLQRLLSDIIARGARHAEPGEFTERAFLSGRIDLTQAEAVLRAVHAMQAGELRNAVAQLRGFAHEEISALRRGIVELMGLLEMNIDFSDQEIEPAGRSETRARLQRIRDEVGSIMRQAARLVPAEGVPVVFHGPPNAGKSTLFNALAGAEKAIVSHVPGTTRDYVEAQIEIEGIPLRLIDTAGISESAESVERAAQARSQDQAMSAGVLVYVREVLDGTAPPRERRPDVIVVNKADLLTEKAREEFLPEESPSPVLLVSALRAEGLDVLKEAIVQAASLAVVGHGFVPNVRQMACLKRAYVSLAAALDASADEIVAYELRTAAGALGEVTGEIPTDEVLDSIFSNFCIGK